MSKQILVVDDEPNIVLSLKFLMDKQGYAVSAASNGDEALQAVEQTVPDLILLDVNMPGRSGFEVCEMVRANPACKATKILMLTAKGRDVDQEKGLALGADDYITKPFSTQEVVAKVKEFLGD